MAAYFCGMLIGFIIGSIVCFIDVGYMLGWHKEASNATDSPDSP